MNPEQIEALVKQVLAQMSVGSSASSAVPATAKIAMLTGERKIEVKEVPIPALGDDVQQLPRPCGHLNRERLCAFLLLISHIFVLISFGIKKPCDLHRRQG